MSVRSPRRIASLTTAVTTLLLAACAPAPVADDTWPGFDPAAHSPVFEDQATLSLHLASDSRVEPLTLRLEFEAGGEFERQIGPRTAVDDVVYVGSLDAGTVTVEVSSANASARRTARLEPGRGHGLALDLRTAAPEPATLSLAIRAAGEADGPPAVRLFALDQALPTRRELRADPAGLAPDLDWNGAEWIAQFDGLQSGEHALRVEPGGIERLLRLDPGVNRIRFELPPPTARLDLELVDSNDRPLEQASLRWVSCIDADAALLLMAPNEAPVEGGRASLATAPGSLRLLIAAPGVGIHTRALDVPEGQTSARIVLDPSRR